MSSFVLKEQFGFLDKKQIHHIVEILKEGINSVKTKNISVIILKIYLSGAYDKVNFLILRLLLLHMGKSFRIVNWIMVCLTSISFSIAINGSAS